jgi:transposase
MHVMDVTHQDETRLVVTVESDADIGGCPECGVVAVGHGRRIHEVADAPCLGIPTLIRWRKRIWRGAEPTCEKGTFSERRELAAPRARLTRRAIRWATDALELDDTSVSAIARRLGVDWHTCWDAIEAEATGRVADPTRLEGVSVLGVDEHIWRPSRVGTRTGR